MLLPVGIDSQDLKVVFVDDGEGIGFWMYSPEKKLFGESKILEAHKIRLQQFELNNEWLILEIAETQSDRVYEKLLQLEGERTLQAEGEEEGKEGEEVESTFQKSINDLSEDELTHKKEDYIRQLIRRDITNPILRPYKSQLNQLLVDNNIFDHQRMMVFAALKTKHVDEKYVRYTSTDDSQIGYLDAVKVYKGEIKVGGAQIQELDLYSSFITDTLINNLYLFAIGEHNGVEFQTRKKLEEKEKLQKEDKKNLESTFQDSKDIEGKGAKKTSENSNKIEK
ncbi:MAG: hypothetical protein AAF316_00210 [Cyanobacteria bacterium P01_A01_bin.80]